LEKLWDPNAMPLSLRFLLENGTDAAWREATVTLTCPEGWRAQGRQPRHWTRPTALHSEATVTLSRVDARSRTVAPFWVQWPSDLSLDLNWHEAGMVPFHMTTQPGPGLTLYATNIDGPLEVAFDVQAEILTETGETIRHRLSVPVIVRPS
ncbi:MAG: hypothetical protein J7M39_09970, partial [Anaerolineae bacterium]|nr:hypothetical protein [Anaerolineae bacterium]